MSKKAYKSLLLNWQCGVEIAEAILKQQLGSRQQGVLLPAKEGSQDVQVVVTENREDKK